MAAFDDPIDLLLDSTGDLVLGSDLSLATGLDGVSQGIRVRILTVFGEWFLNQEIGVKWFDILGQAYDQSLIMTAIRVQILNTPDVLSILSMTANYDSPNRTILLSWKVNTVFGLSVGSLNEELI